MGLIEARWREQFAKLPKGLSIGEIATRLRKSRDVVKRWARQLGYTCKDGRGRPRRLDRIEAIRQLPPNLTTAEVMSRLGWSHGMVYKYFKLAGYVQRPDYAGRGVSREQLADVDWTMQDRDIARIMNVSRELVRLRRKELGKPKSPNHKKRKGRGA